MVFLWIPWTIWIHIPICEHMKSNMTTELIKGESFFNVNTKFYKCTFYLLCSESAKTTLPFVEYCVSHIYGVVYQLCWCPSNAWENNSSEEEVIKYSSVDFDWDILAMAVLEDSACKSMMWENLNTYTHEAIHNFVNS